MVVVFPTIWVIFALLNEVSSVVALAECVDNVPFLLRSATGKRKVSTSAAWIQAKPEVSGTDPSRLALDVSKVDLPSGETLE